jgi:transmembrane sensor
MASSIEIEEIAATWLTRRDQGPWTEADQLEFTQWLDASTGHRVAFLRLQSAWQRADRLKALGAGVQPGTVPAPGEWGTTRFSGGRPPMAPSRTRFHGPFRAIAASLFVALTLGVASWYLWPTGPTYRTPVGGLAAVPLPDGSRATLNTDSEIRVAVTEARRQIDLEEGEAFFEVAKDPNRPFVVVAGDTRVTAVGTKFSVRRLREDVQVVVTEGKVRVERAAASDHAPALQLGAGRVARVGAAGTLVEDKPLPEAEEILSWRSGYVVFKNTTLADAVAEFNRYNDKKLVIEDAAVAGIRIGGNFRSTNAEAFVRLLQEGFPIRVEDDGRRIVLSQI